MSANSPENPHRISDINQFMYKVTQHYDAQWITGEISSFSRNASGHWYFTLKDAQSSVSALMFGFNNQRVDFAPKVGDSVLVLARLDFYVLNGRFQLKVEVMRRAGAGMLQQQFEQLKAKLFAQGLFAPEHKKPLPAQIRRVGVITSATGAALQDIIKVLKVREPQLEVIVYPSLVQGKQASANLIEMIRLANARNECDLLILGRGGGSMEDLWCFNDEALAWAIFESRLPIVSAVGHERDYTIADWVADLRAPTPSAAAEMISQDSAVRASTLRVQQERLFQGFDRQWARKQREFQQLGARLLQQHPLRLLQREQSQLHALQQRLRQGIGYQYQRAQQQTASLRRALLAMNPQQQLSFKRKQFEHLARQLAQLGQNHWAQHWAHWQQLQRALLNASPLRALQTAEQHFTPLNLRLQTALAAQLTHARWQQREHSVQLNNLSPLAVLTRGYSITQNEAGKPLSQARQVKQGDRLITRLKQGEIVSRVETIQATGE